MGVEVDARRDGCIQGGIAGVLGRQPAMMAPGFEVMASQNPLYGRGGDTRNHSRSEALAGQFGAILRGEAAAQRIRTFAGEAYHVERDLRGKNHPWHRGQGRRRARPGAAPARVWPTGGPPSAGPPRSVPPRSGRAQRPGGG